MGKKPENDDPSGGFETHGELWRQQQAEAGVDEQRYVRIEGDADALIVGDHSQVEIEFEHGQVVDIHVDQTQGHDPLQDSTSKPPELPEDPAEGFPTEIDVRGAPDSQE